VEPSRDADLARNDEGSEVGAGVHGDHARHLSSGAGVDAPYTGVGDGTAQEVGVQHTG
jgi:hypothetical protein